ncbi:hypothetical protein PRJ_3323 [Pseudomonas sp. XWY-1]|nr:hypothetical protein PRJ_3323 [Pseudomonas sp. XWY-1]
MRQPDPDCPEALAGCP